MTIRVTSGFVIANDGERMGRRITAADGPVRLPKRLEDRFVRLGAAEYVTDEPTVEEDVPDDPVDENTADAGDAAPVDSVGPDGRETVGDADYAGMDIAELRALCDERGIGYGKRANSAQLVRLLEADDEPPAIEARGVDS